MIVGESTPLASARRTVPPSPEAPKRVAPVDARRDAWRGVISPYESPSWTRAGVQVLNTFVPAIALLVAMVLTCQEHYAITLALAVPAAAFFVLQHDCGHGSFVPSALGNHVLGSIFGLVTITPYFAWRQNHATHHAWSGNLDRRVPGAEFYTMTVAEYRRLSPLRRFSYRAYRSPFVLLGLGALVAFVLQNRRFAPVAGRGRPRDRLSVWGTNVALALFAWAVGFRTYALVYAPIVLIGGTAGVLLFFVQHQFEEGYFVRDRAWRHADSALRGSSYLALPRLLEFFTADIGRHHAHHLSTRVPNYRLAACHRALDAIAAPRTLRLGDVPRLLRLGLWDEERGRLVGFGFGFGGAATSREL